MKVKILRLGHSAQETEAAAGSNVEDILKHADVPHAGYSISVNGLGASPSASVADGDVITLVPKVEGGCR